jgi:hypothetical protein
LKGEVVRGRVDTRAVTAENNLLRKDIATYQQLFHIQDARVNELLENISATQAEMAEMAKHERQMEGQIMQDHSKILSMVCICTVTAWPENIILATQTSYLDTG